MTERGKLARDFGFRDQIQRAAVSVMSNIAEGFDAGSDKAFTMFLKYAFRSATEVQSLLYVASDAGYVTESEFEDSYEQTLKIKRLIGGLMRYLRTSTKQHNS